MTEQQELVVQDEQYGLIKSALQMAYVCGLRTLGEAVANYNRSMYCLSHNELRVKRRMFTQQAIAAIRKLPSLDPTLSIRKVELLTLKQVNQMLELGIDFTALDDELEAALGKEDEQALIDENLERQEWDIKDIFSAQKDDCQ